ncbi:hypothetical protein C8R48DRAFT_773097 [Suillus tomentosus]|nr:hypothetical protein C8R48DRAFT_773097 [Suillus tomentosus]
MLAILDTTHGPPGITPAQWVPSTQVQVERADPGLTKASAWTTTIGISEPINVSYNLKNVPSTEQDALSILTIQDVKGSFLFAHVVVSYVISALIMVSIWWHWKETLRLWQQWFRSPEYMQSFYARTLAVMHVPKKYQSDEGIHAIFASVQVPYPTTSVHIVCQVGRLPELIEYHNTAICKLKHRNRGR